MNRLNYNAQPKWPRKPAAPLERVECIEFNTQLTDLVEAGAANHLKHIEWCHIANERATSPIAGAILKKMGVKAGASDYLIWGVDEFRLLMMGWLEFKRPQGRHDESTPQEDRVARLTPAQAAFRERQLKAGINYYIPYSAKEGIDRLIEWGFLRVQ